MKNFFVSSGERGFELGSFGVPAKYSIISAIETFSFVVLPIPIYPFSNPSFVSKYTCVPPFSESHPSPPPKKEPRVDLQERAILPSIRGLHMYYSIALFTERPKAKRPTSTEHLIHFNVPSKHIYHIHTRARVNQSPPLLLLLAVLIDRTEVVIIVKPI